MINDKRRFWVKKELDFEVEAIDEEEAMECATQFVNAELIGWENGLGVQFRSQRDIEVGRM